LPDRNGEEKRNEEEEKRSREKKMNQMGERGDLYGNFSDRITDGH
jgi:hypothetical protein